MGVEELIADAEIVVRGQVVAKSARWLEREGPSRIVTFYELEVEELLQGQMTPAELRYQRVRIGVLGGEVGAYGQYVHGAPHLEVGESVVAFLGAAGGPQEARGILGFNQGILRTQRASGPDERPIMLSPLREAFEVGARPGSGANERELTLAELRNRCFREANP